MELKYVEGQILCLKHKLVNGLSHILVLDSKKNYISLHLYEIVSEIFVGELGTE